MIEIFIFDSTLSSPLSEIFYRHATITDNKEIIYNMFYHKWLITRGCSLSCVSSPSWCWSNDIDQVAMCSIYIFTFFLTHFLKEIVEYTRIRNSDDTEDSKSCDDSSKNKKRNGINKTKNISKEKQSHDDGSRKKRC